MFPVLPLVEGEVNLLNEIPRGELTAKLRISFQREGGVVRVAGKGWEE